MGLTDTIKNDTRLEPSVPNLGAMAASVIDLVDTAGVYPIVNETGYGMAPSLMAWYAMKCVD